ncbi:DUF5107 domain-containing protein [Arthrobacter agilis]|uniref:DUF5107 domain-containing protein n=1 Tax=Arthrobacter agilis TaxID=37921 RepID=UPI002782A789|nr:DUF5107 domain-containing protein [Arthrobacter agilis]MDQ0734863.1 tetratricopeptide (TPR) repeat protein [Arthrobacter agilis]
MSHADDAKSSITLPPAPADQQTLLDGGGVACWSEAVCIDTYAPEEPDEYPMFLDRRVYQGSSGRVYPIPFTDRIATTKQPRLWQAVHLENSWIRLMILPELGGRIHIGYDKTNGYDFFYRNNVIKPALVGLAGPWISGGVEFNWPQHHRPGTYLPVETTIERSEDGSATVWQGDLDPLQRMRGTHGIRIRPDSSVIEVAVRLYNRTDEPQTFLWWANVAARVHDDYQSFFPTDVHYVADHARRAVTAFPRADRPYYGVDYPARVSTSQPDADRIDYYGNIPVPTSYMITDTEDSFFGGYDHRAGAGFIHWADRSIAPGKKQWTWGNGPVGHAWDRLLTDTDGPYVELMAGVFTDNQPDFSYLAPGETRTFSQFWYPIRAIGPAHQATRDIAVSLREDRDASIVEVGVASATVRDDARIRLRRGSTSLWEATAALAPCTPFTASVPYDLTDASGPLTLQVLHEGSALIEWTLPVGDADAAEPWVATEPPAPGAIPSADELYVTGTHLQQYRHPTRAAAPYFQEALDRDPHDSRSCLALGAWHQQRGEYGRTRDLYQRALARLTTRNLNPPTGEAHYRLALLAERAGRLDEAAAGFRKAAWDKAWAHPSWLGAARIALRSGHPGEALEHARAAHQHDMHSPAAHHAMIVALRRLGDISHAEHLLEQCLTTDPLDPVAQALRGRLAPIDPRTTLTVASDLWRLGDTEGALGLTEHPPAASLSTFGNQEPLRHYLRALWFDALGDAAGASSERSEARRSVTQYAFPSGLDEYDALVAAIAADPTDPVAHALIGGWLLDAGRTSEARDVLHQATRLGSTDPVAWRNAAVATINSGGPTTDGTRYFDRALELRPGDPRLVFERALLAALADEPLEARLRHIERHGPAVLIRDDLTLHYVNLLVDTGRTDEALAIMRRRTFQPFEGGEGKALAAYDRASLAVARRLIETDPSSAVELLEAGISAPDNLSEGRHPADGLAERYVLLGEAREALDDIEGASDAYTRACSGPDVMGAGRAVGRQDFWHGIACLRLGKDTNAADVWASLEARADELEHAAPQVDYFATSLPEMLLFPRHPGTEQALLARRLRALADQGRTLQAKEVSAL